VCISFIKHYLKSNYNLAKTEALKWEKILSTAKDYIAENEKQTITLVDSIQHLYQLLAKRNDEKFTLKKFDVGGQLDYIRDEIEILEEIIKRAHHKMAKESQSMLGEGSKRFQHMDDKGSNLSDEEE
jgi:UTP-glucose-1-phosphate uridylyltransferase